MDFDHKLVLSSDDILEIDSIPKRLAVLGGGAVGVEFASVFRSYGERGHAHRDHAPAPSHRGRGCGQGARLKAFRRRKIECLLGSKVEKVDKTAHGVKILAVVADGKSQILEADVLLSAVGRRPLTDDVGLEKTLAKPDAKGFVQVDSMMRTKEPERLRHRGRRVRRRRWRTSRAPRASSRSSTSPERTRGRSTTTRFPPAPTHRRRWPASASRRRRRASAATT